MRATRVTSGRFAPVAGSSLGHTKRMSGISPSPGTSAPSRRRVRLAVAAAAVASLALAGCSGDDAGTPADDGPDEQAIADGMTLSGRWPLTGLPAEGKAPKHPVMVVKIDNSSSSNPQVGLAKADLVAEELVEGGATRLAVFYYSQLPKAAGPVRSMRATDIGIVQPADAVLIASGGAPPTVRRVDAAGIKTFTEGAVGYFRDPARSAPYNLMMDLPKLADSIKPPRTPEDYLPWGTGEDFPKGTKAKRMAAVFSGGHTTSWQYAKGGYTNLNSQAPEGDRFEPDTVLMLKVPVGDAGYKDPAGNPVPETRLTGTGEALVFHGGRLVRGTWEKDGLDARVQLSTKAGPLLLPPGKVWMELVPANGGDVTIG